RSETRWRRTSANVLPEPQATADSGPVAARPLASAVRCHETTSSHDRKRTLQFSFSKKLRGAKDKCEQGSPTSAGRKRDGESPRCGAAPRVVLRNGLERAVGVGGRREVSCLPFIPSRIGREIKRTACRSQTAARFLIGIAWRLTNCSAM